MKDPESDLSQLDTLTEECILEAVNTRYQRDQIYSSVGEDILIAVNPFKELPIYDKENHEKYRSENLKTNLPPHVFRVAAQAYRRMRQKQSNQIILVCGESGAGKTESAKYMVQHFMQMCPDDAGDLHERIIKVNPLLESFGNAKTVMNDNSSRFAKFLELSFEHDGQVIGASIRDYMLEKCRVVGRNENCGEGNFHIFYGMFAGLSQQEKQDMFLSKPETYSILKGSIESLKMTRHYENQHKENMDTLKKIGMTEADKKVMHCMLAAILHLSQIEFGETDKSSGQLKIVDAELVEQAASLLEVSGEALGHALILSTIIMAGEEIKVYKSLDQARDGRDALAKHMYERLFGWIVKKINTNLHPNDSRSQTKVEEIGILDIAGFENLQTNSFEQMCINMVNERVQYFMNNVLLIQEKKIYESEEIPFEHFKFKDNMNIIQLFEISKKGIWPSLDEESKFPQGTDFKFVKRLKDNFPKGHACYPLLTFARGDRIEFSVKHFAGAVWYNCTNILEKNRDTLNKDIEDVMKSSNDDCIADLFSVRKGDTGTISNTHYNIRASRKVPGLSGSVRAKTDQGGLQGVDLGRTLKEKYGKVGKPTELIYMPRDSKTNVSYFQKSISQLLSKLRHADSFFVRCIKPNRQMAPGQLDEKLVRGQLKYNGISEICLIRKNGYPSRILIEDFIKRYKPLFSFRVSNNAYMVQTILDRTLPIDLKDKYRIGKKKVFMKESVNSHIERVHFVRQKWAASVIANVLRKNCEIQKRERLKKEQEEKERKRKLEEEKKRKKEEEERNRKTEEQRGKDEERTAGSSFEAAGFGNPSNGTGSSYRRTVHDSDSDDTDKTESDDEPIETNRFKDLKGTKKIKEREKMSSSAESSSCSGSSFSPSFPPPRRGSVKKGQPGPPPKKERKFWDIFQTIARETKTQDVHTHTSLRIIKVLTYIVLFLMLLACLVIQKISLAILITGLRPDRKGDRDTAETDTDRAKESSASYMLTLIAVCTPYLLIFIVSVWRSLFGNIPFPSIFSVITCVVIEILHSIGLCLLVFHLLPDLGAVQGIGLLSAVAIVPSLLKPLFSNDTGDEKGRCRVMGKILCFVLDLLAFFVQLSAIPILIVPYTQYIHDKDTNTVSDLRLLESVKIAGALLLCSLSWWENFIDDKVSWCKMSRIEQAFFKLKFDLQESRPFISLFVTIFKVGTSVLFAYLLMKDPLTFDFKENFKVVGNYEGLKLYSDILALVLSGYVGYYLAYTVCKLQMQRLSFSIPCLLSTPIAIIALIFECNLGLDFILTVSKNSLTTSCDDKIDLPWFHIPLAALWLFSFYWVARHIWFPKQERLAKVERLFVNPMYCGILLEQHLVLNRKRHNRRIIIDPQKTYKMTKNDQKSGSTAKTDEMAKEIPPMIYACATMWHENRVEVVQLLKSLFRMDKDQFLRKKAYEMAGCKNMQEIEYYEFEAHILFDDAFELNDDEEMVPNSFVKLFASLMNEAASAVHSKRIELPAPFIIPSHYGGQVIFTMPGGNFIYTHLKDKEKIRHRKRWSQVMYMYYLLGYRIVKECETYLLDDLENTDQTRMQTWDERLKKATGITGKSVIFQTFDEEVLFRAENTFLLALDGDVDFTPGAVRLLLDRMRKNPRVGAACGRIHPIGSGPMVWYQKFEYAVAHWLQKSTEHVLGCVLCSPGCFSLFRGSALMDDNVMHKYTTKPTEPSHHLMYDQGEDRWLCTLLLQQGYRVDYAAASDAFTYAPEGFDEYFKQRRRWTPSTIANILDLLQDGRNTVASNNNISWLYIIYQAALLVSTIIGPATVLMMIAGALLTVFSIDLTTSYIISLIPAIIFFIVCFVFDSEIQLIVAQILSGVYVFIMMVVFVGAIITAVTVTPYHPSVIFLSGLVFIFLIAAVLHPREFHNLIFGILYFLWVPSGFLLLIIYSLCNLHVVSWGTREVQTKKTKEDIAKEKEDKKSEEKQKSKESCWNMFFPFFNLAQDLKQTITEKMMSDKCKEHDKLAEVLVEMNKNLEKLNNKKDGDLELEGVVVEENKSKKGTKSAHFSKQNKEKEFEENNEETYIKQKAEKNKMNDLVTPAWVKEEIFSGGEQMQMEHEEKDFWEGFVNKYLKPLEEDTEKEEKDEEKLIKLRNNVCGGMALINMLWVAINFMFQYKKPTVIDIPLSYGKEEEELDKQQAENVLKVDVVGLMFIIFFLIILLIQFWGMILHRWGTFMHLIAITEIPSPFTKTLADEEMSDDSLQKRKGKIAVEFCEKIMAEPTPDYQSDDESIEENKKEQERNFAREQIKNIAETGTKDRAGQLNIGVSLRNTMIERESTSKSYTNQLRRSAHPGLLNDADFLKKSKQYLAEAKLPKEDKTTGVRYRKNGKGKTLPESFGVRKIGCTAGAQRDIIENVRKNKDLRVKFKLNPAHRNLGESSLGQSFRGGENVNMEDDDIYDEIPPGTLNQKFAKNLRIFNQSFSSSRQKRRNSEFNQFLS